jgi:hypothetical protein
LATQKRKKNIKQNENVKVSLNNYMLNILIFLFLTVIIYLSYSLFIKFNNIEKSESEIRTSGKPSEIIQAEILNGCGVSGAADRYTDYLREKGVDIVKTGNYIKFDIAETIVIDRIGNKANALYVAELLNMKEGNAITQINNDYFVDVTIIIGRDYFKQSPIKKD